ncbi:MAG: response regulator [Acidobacteriota bacterium]|nr:response regulator [Acidobacteriota bacterium]
MNERELIIEDEPNIRRMMLLVFEAEGYLVTDANDGMEGLKAFGDGSQFDLVLLDQKMPGMQGLDVLREIKMR